MVSTKIFTDGSSKGNPGPGGFGAIIVYDKEGKKLVKEIGGGEPDTTNNRMEIKAAVEALIFVNTEAPIIIYSDSSYLVNGITKWVFGWKKNNWITSTKEKVLNRDLWEQLIQVSVGRDINWEYVAGHSDNEANERCDEIATTFASGKEPELYHGELSGYGVDTSPSRNSGAKKSSSRVRTGTAYSYVSKLDGDIQVHRTWDECKKRVHGKNARFKKAFSAEDEKKIIKEFSD